MELWLWNYPHKPARVSNLTQAQWYALGSARSLVNHKPHWNDSYVRTSHQKAPRKRWRPFLQRRCKKLAIPIMTHRVPFQEAFFILFLFFDLFVMLKVAAGNQKNLWEGNLQQILWCVCKSWGIPMEDHIPLGRRAAKPLLLQLGFHRLKDTWCCWWHLLLKNNGPSSGAASFSRLKDTPYYWWLQSCTFFTDKTFRNNWSVHSELLSHWIRRIYQRVQEFHHQRTDISTIICPSTPPRLQQLQPRCCRRQRQPQPLHPNVGTAWGGCSSSDRHRWIGPCHYSGVSSGSRVRRSIAKGG